MAFILGILLFVILAIIAKAVFQFLFLIIDVIIGNKKLTKEELTNIFSAAILMLGMFICIGGLFYFSNEESGELTWHLLIFDVLFIYVISRFDDVIHKSKANEVAFVILYSYPFVWALYSGFAITVFSILNQIAQINF